MHTCPPLRPGVIKHCTLLLDQPGLGSINGFGSWHEPLLPARQCQTSNSTPRTPRRPIPTDNWNFNTLCQLTSDWRSAARDNSEKARGASSETASVQLAFEG